MWSSQPHKPIELNPFLPWHKQFYKGCKWSHPMRPSFLFLMSISSSPWLGDEHFTSLTSLLKKSMKGNLCSPWVVLFPGSFPVISWWDLVGVRLVEDPTRSTSPWSADHSVHEWSFFKNKLLLTSPSDRNSGKPHVCLTLCWIQYWVWKQQWRAKE